MGWLGIHIWVYNNFHVFQLVVLSIYGFVWNEILYTLNDVSSNNITLLQALYFTNQLLLLTFSEHYISSHSILPRNNSVSEGESTTFFCNVTGKGIKNVEWFKDKMRLPSTFYQAGSSSISDLDLTAVTVSQAGAFECRTTIVPRWSKGYQAKTGMLFVKGNWTVLGWFRSDKYFYC